MKFNPAEQGLSRRDMLKGMGAGAALLGLGSLAAKTVAATVGAVERPAPPFTLPPLDYDYAALEPHLDARTMEIHHTKHHQGYINNASKALEGRPELARQGADGILRNLESMPADLRTALRNNVGGHANHSLFWKVLSPKGGGVPGGKLAAEMIAAHGSFAGFKSEFSEAAMKVFGSGWAWLSVSGGKLKIHTTANQDSPLSIGAVPVLGLDVWEHAYYLNYQNRRADYVAAFWQLVNWDQVSANYSAAVRF